MAGSRHILVINCGSSSVKYEVYLMPDKKSLGKGTIERIGLETGKLIQKSEKGIFELSTAIPDHKKALEIMAEAMTDPAKGLIQDNSMISAIGHRVVHGGEKYSESVLIDKDVFHAIEEMVELAPLHNPPNMSGIKAAEEIFANIPNVAVFDTAFHQTIPPEAYMYGIPRELYDKYKIRRYGFHGTSHRYVAGRAVMLMKRVPENTNLITCHLGNGASVTAIENGKSIDTSMGLTPLEGLLMGTRCGDIDPAIIFFLLDRGYSSKEVNEILNKKSGLLGLSGVSNDMRDVKKAMMDGNQKAKETLEVYSHRVKKYIGAYAANLVKLDALVFTGGIGENDANTRAAICERMEHIGIVIDQDKNFQIGSREGIISKEYSPTTILVIPTNEELQIALDAYDLTV